MRIDGSSASWIRPNNFLSKREDSGAFLPCCLDCSAVLTLSKLRTRDSGRSGCCTERSSGNLTCSDFDRNHDWLANCSGNFWRVSRFSNALYPSINSNCNGLELNLC